MHLTDSNASLKAIFPINFQSASVQREGMSYMT